MDLLRLRSKFEKYVVAMNDELVEAINGHDLTRPSHLHKSTRMKKVNDDTLMMVMYCLQPTIRSQLTVFDFNKNEKLPEILLQTICKCMPCAHQICPGRSERISLL